MILLLCDIVSVDFFMQYNNHSSLIRTIKNRYTSGAREIVISQSGGLLNQPAYKHLVLICHTTTDLSPVLWPEDVLYEVSTILILNILNFKL